MRPFFFSVIVGLSCALTFHAQTGPDSAELTSLLKEFLDGASRNDAAIHDRFWAEELVYTGSNGRRRSKAEVMRDVRSAPAPKPGEPTTIYTAEEVRIEQYGDTALIAFRLVGTTNNEGKIQVSNYLNTGTFLRRNGKWQVVGWQATKMQQPDEELRKEVAATEAAFHKAVLDADTKILEKVVDDSFIWTHRTGEQMTRKQLLDQIGSGQLKYSKLETNNVVVAVYGDTAVVRGVSPRQRSKIPNSDTRDVTPFNAFYTLTFINKGGAWKAVAMHSSRPQ